MILNAVRLPHHNKSAEKKTITPPLPPKVIIGLHQNIGAPCEPLVKPGDTVTAGQIIGDSSALVSVPVHSSVDGVVEGETQILSPWGKMSRALVIATSTTQSKRQLTPPEVTDKESFVKAVRASGSVGLGGAGFPTHIKFAFDKLKTPVDTLVVNGAECEPFITGDYREIIENGGGVIDGIRLVLKYLSIPRAVIGVEKDKPKAIELLRKLSAQHPEITVKELPLKYPQGAEKILIFQTVGRKVMEGELPSHHGCIVLNVSTVAFIADYIKTGVPLITRRLTIDGDIVNNAKNVFVPVGTPLEEIVKLADLRKPADRIVFGGPMMGTCAYDMQTPVTKTTGAVLFFGETKFTEESACIRCGKCIHVCSMHLSPYDLNRAYDAKDVEALKRLKLNLCMCCSACSYICPAKRNICERNIMAKQLIK